MTSFLGQRDRESLSLSRASATGLMGLALSLSRARGSHQFDTPAGHVDLHVDDRGETRSLA
jgi:hypothetical protein